MLEKSKEIRFKPTFEERKQLEELVKRFELKYISQALRLLIKLSSRVDIRLEDLARGDSLAKETPKKIEEGA